MFSFISVFRRLGVSPLWTPVLRRITTVNDIPEFAAAKEKLLKTYKAMNDELEKVGPQSVSSDLITRWNRLQPIGEHLLGLEFLQNSQDETEKLLKELGENDESENDLNEIAALERNEMLNQVTAHNDAILQLLVPPEPYDECNVLLEISSGAGGQEAMLFSQELLDMYAEIAAHFGWSIMLREESGTEIGGVRFGSLLISGVNAYRTLKYEGGIHRVQRIPRTSNQGKIHTSTAAVAVIPRTDTITIEVKKEDIKVDAFKASGKGGQHVNTTDSAVRVTHLPTGMTAESQDTRSQNENRSIAIERLRVKLQDRIIAEEEAQKSASVRLQVGGRDRSEKIRTYNFPQDRLTDHRLSRSWSNMARLMAEPELFQTVLDAMQEAAYTDRLLQILRKILNEGWQ